MPYIKVDVDKIREYQRSVYDIRKKVYNVSNDFADVASRLDYDVKEKSGINRRLQSLNTELSEYKRVLDKINRFVGDTAFKYVDADVDVDKIVEQIAKAGNLPVEKVREVVLSGEYSGEDLLNYANGKTDNEDLKNRLNTLTYVAPTTQYTKEETKEIIALAAQELNISETDIQDLLDQGLATTGDIVEFLSGAADITNKFVKGVNTFAKFVTGASKIAFNVKNGLVIVSKFTRNGLLNKLVKWAKGTGIGTKYTPNVLKDTPILGGLYKLGEFSKKVDKVTNVVVGVASGISGVIDATEKIKDIWENDELSQKEKIIDTAAVGITSAVGTAIDVAAPFVGTAVQTAVTAAIPVPIVGAAVGFAAGWVVEKGLDIYADVIRSEAVVNQVSSSITNVGDALSSGVAAISDAAQKIVESKNVGEAIVNTAAAVGTVAVEAVKTGVTVAVEAVKTSVTVAVEAVKTVGNAIGNAAKAVGNWFKKW